MWCRNAEQVAQGVLIPLILLVATIACSRASSNADGADAQFVANASSGGMAEVKLGQLAEERGASQEVKNFGHKMVDDHRASGKKLQMTASKEGMTLSNDLSQEDRATYDKLSKLSGAEFDRAYAADMVKDHQHEIAEFEKEAKYGKDPAVRQFAQETLPTLREHLQLAEKMERGISAASGR